MNIVDTYISCNYTIDPAAEEPIMLILKQIGNEYDEYGNCTEWGIQGDDFCRELLYLDTLGKKRIHIWINSIGGSVIDGYSILGGMLKCNTPITTYNIGVAASTAGWLFQAGDERDMCDYATWMGHNPQGEDCEIKERMRLSIVKIISERTGKAETEIEGMLDKETYMNADECLAAGFCDKVSKTSEGNKKQMDKAKTVIDKLKTAGAIANTMLPKKVTIKQQPIKNNSQQIQKPMENDFQLIRNKVNLFRELAKEAPMEENPSQAQIANEFEKIGNKLTVTETNLAKVQNELTISNKAKDDLQKEYDDLKKQMDKIKAEMEAEEETNRVKAATDMVNSFATLGKIENKKEVIDFWVDLASVKGQHDNIKNQLAAIPVNKEAKKIIIGDLGTGELPNMAMVMAKIANKGQK